VELTAAAPLPPSFVVDDVMLDELLGDDDDVEE
jgi:hypothetical protein